MWINCLPSRWQYLVLVEIEPATSRFRVRCFTTAPKCPTAPSKHRKRDGLLVQHGFLAFLLCFFFQDSFSIFDFWSTFQWQSCAGRPPSISPKSSIFLAAACFCPIRWWNSIFQVKAKNSIFVGLTLTSLSLRLNVEPCCATKQQWRSIKIYLVVYSPMRHLKCGIHFRKYSEIPLLRPPKIKTFCQLKTLFAKFKLFFSSFSSPSVSLIRDHLWDCPKVVFKTTFGQSQRWS